MRSSLLVVASLCVLASHGHADRALPRVELTLVDGADRTALVEERVTSWFRGQPGSLATQRATTLDREAVLSTPSPAGVQIWIVLTDPTRVQLFFTVRDRDGATPRYLVTDVSLPSGLDELGVEQLAQIVYPSATAVWDGSLESTRTDVEHELARRPAPPPPSPPAPPALAAPAPTTRTLALGPEYGVSLTGAGLAQMVGAQLHLGLRRLGARVHLAAILPRTTEASGVELELAGATAALGATLTRSLGRTLGLSAEAGAGLEVSRFATGALADPSLIPTDGGYVTRPHLYTRTGIGFPVAGASVGLEATVAFHLVRTHYDVMMNGRSDAVIVPWLVQPGLAAHVAW